MTIFEKNKILRIKKKFNLYRFFIANKNDSVYNYDSVFIIDEIQGVWCLVKYSDRGGILETFLFYSFNDLCDELKQIKKY